MLGAPADIDVLDLKVAACGDFLLVPPGTSVFPAEIDHSHDPVGLDHFRESRGVELGAPVKLARYDHSFVSHRYAPSGNTDGADQHPEREHLQDVSGHFPNRTTILRKMGSDTHAGNPMAAGQISELDREPVRCTNIFDVAEMINSSFDVVTDQSDFIHSGLRNGVIVTKA
jgi:hypothetical protein